MSNVTELYEELQQRLHKGNDSLFDASGILKEIMEAPNNSVLLEYKEGTAENRMIAMNHVMNGLIAALTNILSGENHV